MCFYQEISIINHFTKTFNQSDETIMIGHLSNLDFIERAFVILFIVGHPGKDAVADVQKIIPCCWMCPESMPSGTKSQKQTHLDSA